jgi:hypothetical protein
MAYQVNRFNGETLVNVADGTIDTTTDLRLVGRNYAGYGEVQNENFVHLLENFANTTAPPKALTGQIWYDSNSTTKKIKYYDGSRWKVASGAEASPSAPTGLSTGDFWWDTTAKQLYAWTGTEFALIGPEASPDLGSSIISAAVVKGTIATNLGPHTVLKVITDDKVVGIFSKTEFTLDSVQNPIEDFSVIKKGFTLAKSSSGVSTDNYVMWGTAQNANLLGGVPAANYLQIGDNEFTEEVIFKDPGFTVGDGNDLRIRVENGDEVIVENRLGNPIYFRITVTENTDERDVGIVRSTGIFPGTSNTYKLGGTLPNSTEVLRWSEVNATTFNGSVIGNVTGNITGNITGNLIAQDATVMIDATTKQIGYVGASIIGTLTGSCTGSAATATNASQLNSLLPSVSVPGGGVQSIPVRDASGNITANQFIGISDNTDRMRINDAASDSAWNGAVVSTQYRSAKTTKTAYTIAARDSSGNLAANIFDGTATAAQYADLAEKYLPDADYDVGTVVAVGGEKEITAAGNGHRAIGVISANPAFMMNKDLEGGVYVALKGRVPVKVVGKVIKGQRLVAVDVGVASTDDSNSTDVFAVALESSDNTDIKLIEAVIL